MVTVVPNDADTADAEVDVRFADGVSETLEVHLANPMSDQSWRFVDVGVYPSD